MYVAKCSGIAYKHVIYVCIWVYFYTPRSPHSRSLAHATNILKSRMQNPSRNTHAHDIYISACAHKWNSLATHAKNKIHTQHGSLIWLAMKCAPTALRAGSRLPRAYTHNSRRSIYFSYFGYNLDEVCIRDQTFSIQPE